MRNNKLKLNLDARMRKGERRMLRIAICCGGGFSSSTMAAHLNKQLEEKGLTDEVFLEFIPFGNLYGGTERSEVR